MEKEYLLMVKVRADKKDLNARGRALVYNPETKDTGYFDPDILIDPKDLDYSFVEIGDIYFDGVVKDWIVAIAGTSLRSLIHRKPKDKWQAWEDQSPFGPTHTAWIKNGIKIGKGE